MECGAEFELHPERQSASGGLLGCLACGHLEIAGCNDDVPQCLYPNTSIMEVPVTCGEPVLIRTTASLKNPKVVLGGAPLESLQSDNTTVFGRVAKRAVLGDVSLTSDGTSAPAFSDLFAVLFDDPQPVIEIEQQTGGVNLALMQTVVDLASAGNRLWLLGSSGRISSDGTAGGLPILLFTDRVTKDTARVPVPVLSGGRPVAPA